MLTCLVQAILSLQYTAPRVFEYQGDDDPGQPLILTPYIQNGQIDQGILYASIVMLSLLYLLLARSLSQVKGISTKLSYSGKLLYTDIYIIYII